MSTFKGTIKLIGEKQTFDSGFTKVEFVVTETADQYPQDIKFEIVKDKVDDFLKYNKVGKEVEVSYNLRGNEYNGKYYVSLQAWKVFGVDAIRTNEESIEEPEDSEMPF